MWFTRKVWWWFLLLSPCGYGNPLPTPQDLLDSYHAELTTLEAQLNQGLASVKTEWTQQLNDLRAESRLQANVSDWLWAERMLRVTGEMNQNWIGIFAEPPDGNESVSKLKQEVHERIKTLKKTAVKQVDSHEKDVRENLKLLEQELVKANRVEEAIACRQTVAQVEKSKIRQGLANKIKHLDAKSYWKRDRKRRRKLSKQYETAGVPPNARFIFTKSNKAYTAVVEAATVLSAGNSAGPAAGIRLGKLIDKRGTRGLTVVAFYNQELLIDDTFDTYADFSESERLTRSVKELPYGSFVVMAVRDDATRRFSGGAQSTLKRLGAEKGIQDLPYRSAYLMIGIKGLVPGHAVEKWSSDVVRLSPVDQHAVETQR